MTSREVPDASDETALPDASNLPAVSNTSASVAPGASEASVAPGASGTSETTGVADASETTGVPESSSASQRGSGLIARLFSPTTLRRKLVLVVVAVVAGISVVIGAVSILALRNSLLGQLDNELESSFSRAQGQVLGTGPAGGFGQFDVGYVPDAWRILNGPGQASGTLALVINGQDRTAGYLADDGSISQLTVPQLTSLASLAIDGAPHIINLGSGLGNYKLMGGHENGVAFVVGLPLEPVNTTVSRLAWIIVLISILGASIVALVATAFVRSSLRPLERVSAAASRVSESELDRGAVESFEGVSTEGIDAESEVGHVVTAFNTMLDSVGNALTVREQSENKVRRFVADASHELRTPLASIRGYSELIKRIDRENSNPDVTRSLERIESESIRMTGLVEDLLLLARLDEGKELVTGAVDLSEIVTNTVSDARVTHPEHEWEMSVPENPLTVLGDAAKLNQVVLNLITNAHIHTPPGTRVTVTLDSVAGKEKKPTAQITVADNGPGIPPEQLSHIFERFVRGDESRVRSTGSTGLGLSIVQALVVAHGGTIHVTSSPGDTRFIVQLPLAPPQSS
ncbi:HAMP domain-containing sensor histidine kinase [Lysinibacter sp. HNR]|uniref:sensor histidine kinase n=1 Tax=Lysinibacter sp. HNR TaxID=3031408 RepID=UPI00243537B0|nr:HAMP domain-containing sensor histidine kinase [Lysinibacter sp. HNR]WGD37775.1 HAMP domain-containing sensor histidine kinase [Lysinibacter sp. HNR]